MGRPFSPKKRIMIRPIVMRKLGRDETRIVYKPSLPLRGGKLFQAYFGSLPPHFRMPAHGRVCHALLIFPPVSGFRTLAQGENADVSRKQGWA
jgi:hypothetical protein